MSCLKLEITLLIQNSFTCWMRSANSSYCLICLVKSNMVFSLVGFGYATGSVPFVLLYVALQHLSRIFYIVGGLFRLLCIGGHVFKMIISNVQIHK